MALSQLERERLRFSLFPLLDALSGCMDLEQDPETVRFLTLRAQREQTELHRAMNAESAVKTEPEGSANESGLPHIASKAGNSANNRAEQHSSVQEIVWRFTPLVNLPFLLRGRQSPNGELKSTPSRLMMRKRWRLRLSWNHLKGQTGIHRGSPLGHM